MKIEYMVDMSERNQSGDARFYYNVTSLVIDETSEKALLQDSVILRPPMYFCNTGNKISVNGLFASKGKSSSTTFGKYY